MKKIAIIDPSSRSIPYDYYYINEISKYFFVDFYCSNTGFNKNLLINLNSQKNIKIHFSDISNVGRIKGIFNYLVLLKIIFRKKDEYEKIHFQWYIFFIIEIFYFWLIRKKLIFTFHNEKPHSFKGKYYFPNMIVYTLALKVVFVSEYVQKIFFKNYSIKNIEKSVVLKHGIMDVSLDEEPDNKMDNSALENRIVFWGNVKKYKGIDFFIEIINSGLFSNFKLEIYGKWDESLYPLKKILSNRGCLILDKYLDDFELIDLFKTKPIFILPYKEASQSGILYTLLNYKCIFISTNTGDNGDFLFKNDLKELLFDVTDISSFMRSLNYVFNNKLLIENKMILIKNNYKWENLNFNNLYS